MIIVADQNIPHVADAFAGLGEVRLLPGRDIRREHLGDCTCLLTRTVTRVDAALIAGTPIEFVASATIGTDHVDLDYLESAGIGFSNAAGCNAEAAAEYVVSGLFALSAEQDFDPRDLYAGIVGYGNVGSRLKRIFDTLGIDSLLCDPPLAAAGGDNASFVELDEIIERCDLISLHVPLTRGGDHSTWHLLQRDRLRALRPGCILVNTARGEVIDNPALGEILGARPDLRVFLDTWENEPLPARDLLRRVDLATPHIAGYSIEGRLRGTQMVLDAICAHFGRDGRWRMQSLLPPEKTIESGPAANELEAWQDLFRRHCDIRRDHDALLRGADFDDAEFAIHFDGLRRVYDDRREYESCRVIAADGPLPPARLRRLGFRVAV